MLTRDKEKYTRDAVIANIKRLKDELAKFVEDNIGKDSVSLNTQELHQKIGALRALRGALYQ